jgi:hypothetical protein
MANLADVISAFVGVVALIITLVGLFQKQDKLKLTIVRFGVLALFCLLLAWMISGFVGNLLSPITLFELFKFSLHGGQLLKSSLLTQIAETIAEINFWLGEQSGRRALISRTGGLVGWSLGLVLGWQASKTMATYLCFHQAYWTWVSSKRLEAAEALEESGSIEMAVEVWRTLALDSFVIPEVRMVAAEALERLGRVEVATEAWLAIACDRSADGDGRLDAAQELGRLEQVQTAEQAWTAIVRDRKLPLKNQLEAAKVLIDLEYSDLALEILLRLARHKRASVEIRLEVAKGLQSLGQQKQASEILRDIAGSREFI